MQEKNHTTYFIIAAMAVLFALAFYLDSENQRKPNDEIILLYTNDVHCAVDQHIGYAGLVAYKKDMELNNKNVVLIDCGDATHGEYIGNISKGSYIIDIMNKAGYDLAIFGNHEFDYGMDVLKKSIARSKAKYLNCNITYNGSGDNALSQTASYTILTYGKTKLGFVGVTVPTTTNTSSPGFFQEKGKFVYDFKPLNSGKDLFDTVQTSVNSCLEKGAHYVILLAHLGTGDSYEPYTSTNLIANTTGIDAVLDGHSHTTIPFMLVKNKMGKNVVLSSTGERLNCLGQMTISPEGIVSKLITTYGNKDEEMSAFINKIKSSYVEELKKVLGVSNTLLSRYDSNFVRIIRNRETNLGNWVTDALLNEVEGDIALFNGGSIRSDIPIGEVSVGTLNAVNGFNNMICKIEATGQEILDTLEMSYRLVLANTTNDGKWSIGENGGFLQLSGLKCTIDTSVPSSVVVDENGMFIKVGGQRRVKDVMVKKNGRYEPIIANKKYSVVSTNYLVIEGGDGINNFANHSLLIDGTISVTDAYINYFNKLNGDLSGYSTTQGRITIK